MHPQTRTVCGFFEKKFRVQGEKAERADLDFRYDDLKFMPLFPALDTGAVLVWKKNQMFQDSLFLFQPRGTMH